FRLLVDAGADLKASAAGALLLSMRSGCKRCIDMVIGSVDRQGLNQALVVIAPFGDAQQMQTLLDRGADVDAKVSGMRPDLVGRTPLMLAASSDFLPVDAIKILISSGADINEKGTVGGTAVDMVKRYRHTHGAQ